MNRSILSAAWAAVFFIGLATLTGCGGAVPSAPSANSSVAITSFVANPTLIAKGTPSSLTAVFSSGVGVIMPGNIAVTSGASVNVTPTSTTTYTLTVTNLSGAPEQKIVTVAVNSTDAPSITSFAASPSSIAPGASTTLTATFLNGTGIVTPGKLAITSGKAITVKPSATTTYTLTVTPSAGSAIEQSTTVAVTTLTAPANPTDLIAVASDNQVSLYWNSSSEAVSYNILEASSSGGTTSKLGSSSSTRYLDSGLADGVTRWYQVVAVNSVGVSGPSNWVSATPTASSSQLPPPDDSTKNRVGLGTWGLSDWDGSSAFVDVFKQSRLWRDPQFVNPASVDSLGWPTQDASTILSSYPFFENGTYKLIFNGKAKVGYNSFAGSVANVNTTADANGNYTTTADVIVGPAQQQHGFYLTLIFTNTQRTASSPVGSGITNARLYRPGYPTDGSAIFTTPFLNAMSKVGTVRMMDWTATNGNYVVNWADRVTPESATQAGLPNPTYTDPAGKVYNGSGGVALEYQIMLCNTLVADCYINIPMVANDEFVTNMALALAFGTDGTNPYTSPQAKPVFPPLNPNLHLYLEYANEVWNTVAGVSGVLYDITNNLSANDPGNPLLTINPTTKQ